MLTINEQNQVKEWLQAELDGVTFPVEFDIAWGMAGYSKKANAKRKLTNQSSYLIKDEDYMINPSDVSMLRSEQWTQDGRLSDRIVMTCDAFKHFCLMAQTAKGREIRQYFIEAEKALNDAIPTCQKMSQEIERLKAQIASMENDHGDYIPNKFQIHHAQTPLTEVYTVVCDLQEHQYFRLMTYVLPPVIANEPDFEKYCILKRVAMAPLYEFVKMLNKMSRDFTPCFESTVYKYLATTK